ncbi:MAG TPA: SGNH/GDSL hydrolase family protein, partial [Conexibacter sp.]|nr:SGNH/GDSL hydrolase family protein [Conexibacter sp.]
MRSRAAALAALALAALALLATAATAASGRYVALGDSYTAGPLIPDQSLSPLGCLRSDVNYPHLVRPSLEVATFTDISCSGATTDDFTAPQSTSIGTNPPQFDALTADTRVVTVGIGGNDIGFSDIVLNCARLNPFDPCRDDYVHDGIDEISQAIAATAPKIDAAIDGIQARSPNAKVHLVGYPVILPASGFGCWPSVPILPTDVFYLRAKEIELNGMLAARAAAGGAFYVDTYTSSVGHDVCRGTGTKWVE